MKLVGVCSRLSIVACLAVGLGGYIRTVVAAPEKPTATLKGKFVLEGVAPPADLLARKKTGKDGCDQHALVSEAIAVGAANELANVFVYLRTPGVESPARKVDYVGFEIKYCRFEPHCVVMKIDQTLVIRNVDPFGHSSKVDTFLNASVGEIFRGEICTGVGANTIRFGLEEALPAKVVCSTYPWMDAWILIRENSFAAVSDKTGEFNIVDLPLDQELEFQVWQESAGYVKNILSAGGGTDAKGRFKIKLKAGENNLGEIKVPLSALKK